MIPIFGCQAGGGKIYSLDDPTVVTDGADSAGVGGSTFAPYIVSTFLANQFDMGYNKLRRFQQRLSHNGTCTVQLTGIRDGQQSGQPSTQGLAISDVGLVTAPLNDAGSTFQIKIALTAFSAAVTLGASKAFVVPKREWR